MTHNGDNLRRVLGILISLALGAGMVSAVLVTKACAQTRYDYDQQWIRKTIRKQRYEAWRAERREEAREEWREARERERERERRAYAEWRRTHDRYYGYRREEAAMHPATRVYGVVMRRGFSERDATSHVECYPQVQGLSREHLSEDGAWGDAQRDWSNKVRWMHGERWMDLRYAGNIEKQCTISSVKESVAGRIVQGAKQVVGGDAVGSNWRCMVRASPCQAPIEGDPNIKGGDQVREGR